MEEIAEGDEDDRCGGARYDVVNLEFMGVQDVRRVKVAKDRTIMKPSHARSKLCEDIESVP